MKSYFCRSFCIVSLVLAITIACLHMEIGPAAEAYAGGNSTDSPFGAALPRMGLPHLDTTGDTRIEPRVAAGMDVFAGGSSINRSGTCVAGYWKNGAWKGLPSLYAAESSEVYSLAVVPHK